MIHPDTRLSWISDEIGLGVVATRVIPRGTLTWVQDPLDRVLEPGSVELLPEPVQHALAVYSFHLADGSRVLCWDNGRFVNHSCEPTCVSVADDLELAVRDIQPGEQLTNEYAMLNLPWTLECRCGSPACRRRVGPRDGEALATHHDLLLEGVRGEVEAVRQPLRPLLDAGRWSWLLRVSVEGFPPTARMLAR